MISDGIIDLVANDVVNNKYKGTHLNKTITAFCGWDKEIIRFYRQQSFLSSLWM